MATKFAGVRVIPGQFAFARWNKPRWALLLLLVFTGNILVATIAWISVRFVH
jgi:hypothetical protein